MEGQGPLPPTVEVHVAKRVDEVWPDCPAEIADFVPDGIIITIKQTAGKHPSRVIVFEFAHSYTIEEDELLSVGAAKRNQYQSLVQFLRPRYPRRSPLPQLHHEHAWPLCPSTGSVDSELRIHRVYSPPDRQ
eukprot:2199588-Rhodomonas_salina.1